MAAIIVTLILYQEFRSEVIKYVYVGPVALVVDPAEPDF